MRGNKYVLFCLIMIFSGVIHAQEVKKDTVLKKDTFVEKPIQNAVKELKEVKISTSRRLMERKLDRIVFNTEQSIGGVGTDALDLIGKVPGVKVSGDKISLVAKGDVSVMINERLLQLSADDLASYLKSIPSDQISKVEIITNPPAKYDAQGNNGLINIVLKKAINDGVQGAVNLNYTRATHDTFSGGGTLTYRKDRFTVYSSFNLRKGSIEPTEETNIFYPAQTWNIFNQFRNFRTVPNAQLGLDYQLSKSILAGVSYNGGKTNFHSDEQIRTSVYNQSNRLDSVLVSDANAKIRSNFNSTNFFFKKTIDTTGKQLVLNADWFKYNDDKQRSFDNHTFLSNGELVDGSFAQYLSASHQNVDLYTLKADVDLSYKNFKLSFGGKLSFIKNKSDVSFYQKKEEEYVLNLNQTNIFDYSENTQAMYVNFNKTIQKWTIQAGLRGEYTQTKGISSVNNGPDLNKYFQLFPTVFLTYRLNEENSFGFSYGRRINRPPYSKLNPFRWYNNQYSYMEGNPFLKPSYSSNLELSHTYAGIWTTALSFSQTTAGFGDVNFVNDQSNIQILRPVNFITAYQYQVSNSIALSPADWLQSNNQVNFFYAVSKSSLVETMPSLRGRGLYLSTRNSFYLNRDKTFSGEASFWCQFNGVEGLQRLKNQSSLDLGISTLFLNKKLQLAVNVTDIFKTDRQSYTSLVNGIHQSNTNYYDNRQLRISIRYSFGNDRVKSPSRKAGNEEERKRNN